MGGYRDHPDHHLPQTEGSLNRGPQIEHIVRLSSGLITIVVMTLFTTAVTELSGLFITFCCLFCLSLSFVHMTVVFRDALVFELHHSQ